ALRRRLRPGRGEQGPGGDGPRRAPVAEGAAATRRGPPARDRLQGDGAPGRALEPGLRLATGSPGVPGRRRGAGALAPVLGPALRPDRRAAGGPAAAHALVGVHAARLDGDGPRGPGGLARGPAPGRRGVPPTTRPGLDRVGRGAGEGAAGGPARP